MIRSLKVAALLSLAANIAPAIAQQSAADQLSRAIRADQPARSATRRVQIFSEAFTTTSRPYVLNLDSGVAYRVLSSVDTASLTITPRITTLAPIRLTSMVSQGGAGVRFVAPASLTYSIESGYSGRSEMIVRIYREEAVDCTAEPGTSGCEQDAGPTHRGFHISPAVVIMAGFLPLLFAGLMRNGRSF